MSESGVQAVVPQMEASQLSWAMFIGILPCSLSSHHWSVSPVQRGALRKATRLTGMTRVLVGANLHAAFPS